MNKLSYSVLDQLIEVYHLLSMLIIVVFLLEKKQEQLKFSRRIHIFHTSIVR
jgi:hypothetical protein